MSIILKGIDLPKEQSLLVFIANNGAVVCSGEDGVMTTEAIQIPKGHGRIVDLDELQVNVTKVMTYGDALHEIKKVPTILESEVMPK